MADIKISELGAASAVNSADIFPMTSSGVTVKATAQQIKNFVGVGNLADLNTTDKSSTVAAINEVDSHADNANSKADNVQQMIAPIQSNLTASKAYAVGEQFVYNGLLYKAIATIAQGGTITIDGNCALADSVTAQLAELEYSNSSIVTNWWAITVGDWYVYRKGKVVTIYVDLGFTQALPAVTEYDIRILPDWAKPSRDYSFTRIMPDNNVNVLFGIRPNGHITLFGYQQILLQPYHFYDTWEYTVD